MSPKCLLSTVLLLLSHSFCYGAHILAEGIDVSEDMANFFVTYDSPPDFVSSDSFGRPANQFQFFLNPSPPSPSDTWPSILQNSTVVVRGLLGQITIESFTTFNTGIGPAIGTMPLDVSGNSVEFSIPLTLLGITDNFSYLFGGYMFGATDVEAIGAFPHVPEAPSMINNLSLISVLVLAWGVNKRTRKTFVETRGGLIFGK